MWTVLYLRQADQELRALPTTEHTAVIHAVEKLEAMGPGLRYPHSSAVRATDHGLRELRPRAGRSPWRALYQRVGEAFVVAAIAPEAESDPRGFSRATRRALERLAEIDEE